MSLTVDSCLWLADSHSLNAIDATEGVVLDLAQRRFRGLNETALFILARLDAARQEQRGCTVAELLVALVEHFDGDEETMQADLLAFLGDCLERGIVRQD